MDDDFHTGQKKRHRLFTDAADRLADNTGYVIQDVNALGLQVDTGEVFYLKSIHPTLWVSTRAAQAQGVLSSVQFSISHEFGDGDFKLDAASSAQTFLLSTVLSGIKGVLLAVEINLTQSFNNIGSAAGVNVGRSGIDQAGWLSFLGAQGPASGQFSMDDPPNVFAGSTPNGRTAFPENYIGSAGQAAQVRFDTDAGPNVNLATTGKLFITLHYLATPTATG